ncbi:ExbD/TolR family protein [Gilvimarinus sp. F26214L]|uniref:ExbD/TolR family protein n=1 Tax=Gilvimarinus sp. DZF01 TaxID=3461371 RepID=UPI004045E045
MFQSAFKQKKPSYTTKLNLVALMDIFTILVFFLLLNSGEAEKLENAEFVKLPDSHAGTPPHDDLVVMIGSDAIWLGEQMIASIEDVADSGESSIAALSEALADFRERKGELNSYEEENGLSLTIMGDHAVPYGLLKTVMSTARLENFRDIALAVNQVAGPAPAADDTPPSLADRSIPDLQGER